MPSNLQLTKKNLKKQARKARVTGYPVVLITPTAKAAVGSSYCSTCGGFDPDGNHPNDNHTYYDPSGPMLHIDDGYDDD
jgi:hypothetical protein